MKLSADVAIVGAGPVGLLLANLLARSGIRTVLVEKNDTTAVHSRAIGITPPSLEILESLELQDRFIEEGLPIRSVHVHGSRRSLGRVTFDQLPSPYRFILSIPQRKTEQLLLEHLRTASCVRLLMNCEMEGLEEGADSVTVRARLTGAGPPVSAEERQNTEQVEITARYLCGCDGLHSTVRTEAGLSMRGKHYSDTFLMGDYIDRSGYGAEAQLFFTSAGSVESFPLPRNRRRWIVQTPALMDPPSEGYLEKEVKRRSRQSLSRKDNEWLSPFRVSTYIMPRFYRGRIIFIGDAAHTISPIGGQGMNTGFADAELAAHTLQVLLQSGHSSAALEQYHIRRRRAAVTAARRGWLSMRVGTVHGRLFSPLRNAALRLLLASRAARRLPLHYAMLTIPHRNLKASKTHPKPAR